MKTTSKRRRKLLIFLLVSVIGIGAWEIGWQFWGAYHYRVAQLAIAKRQLAVASHHLKACLSVWPNDGMLWLLAARTSRREAHIEDAKRALSECQRLHVLSEAVALEKTLYRVQLGDLADASKYLNFFEKYPEASEAALAVEALVVGAKATGDVAEVQRCAELWLAHCSGTYDRVQGFLWRAWADERRGDYRAALDAYRQANALDAENDEASLALAAILSREEPAEAAERLEKLRVRQPRNREVLYQLAVCRRSLGSLEEAGQLLDEVLASDPRHLPALLERGKLAMDLGEFGEAESWLRKAHELGPNQREPNLLLGRCLQQSGKQAEAAPYLEKFAQIEVELQKQLNSLQNAKRPAGS